MKKLKTLLFTILVTMATQISVAQDKVEQRAQELVKEMNAKLSESTKLSGDQEKQILQLYIEKIKEIKTAKNEISDEVLQKEKIKEINKSYGKKINETILTKEQKAAIKEHRKNKNLKE